MRRASRVLGSRDSGQRRSHAVDTTQDNTAEHDAARGSWFGDHQPRAHRRGSGRHRQCRLSRPAGRTAMTRIGVVGLGAMGGRIAGRLLAHGHDVYGSNRTRAKADPLIAQGLVWCDSPRAIAQRSEIVISMVTDEAALTSVTDGPDGILAGLAPGSVYLEMSTVSPHASRTLAGRVAAEGAAMVAAPLSGSV